MKITQNKLDELLHSTIPVNFESVDLSGLDFSGKNLFYAKVSNSNLTNTNLVETNLKGAILEEVDFSGADLTKARFTKSKIQQSNFCNTKMIQCVFYGAEITHSEFDRTDLTEADFTCAKVVGSSYNHAILTNAKFRATDFRSINYFREANLQGVDFMDADLGALEFEKACLRNARFDNVNSLHDFYKVFSPAYSPPLFLDGAIMMDGSEFIPWEYQCSKCPECSEIINLRAFMCRGCGTLLSKYPELPIFDERKIEE